MKQPAKPFALCIDHADYEASLIPGKVYRITADPKAAKDNFIVHHKVKTTGFSRSALAAKIVCNDGVEAWTIDTGVIRYTRLNTTLCG